MVRPNIALVVTIGGMFFWAVLAGDEASRGETAKAKRALEASERAAQRIDAQWKLRGKAAIPDMLRAVCRQREMSPLWCKAEAHLCKLSLPELYKNLQILKKNNTSSDCTMQLVKIMASVYCAIPSISRQNGEWGTGVELMKTIFRENPAEGLNIILELASIKSESSCSNYEPLLKEVIPLISEVLCTPSGKVRKTSDIRSNALEVVSKIGPSAEPLVPKIIPLLGDQALSARAAKALAKIGPPALAATEELLKAMKADDKTGGIPFAEALAAIGAGTSAILSDVESIVENLSEQGCDGKNNEQLCRAVDALCRLACICDSSSAMVKKWFSGSPKGEVVEIIRQELIKARLCPKMPVREICNSLTLLGKSGAAASGEMMEFVRDRHEDIRTRGEAASAIDKTKGKKNLTPPDRQLMDKILVEYNRFWNQATDQASFPREHEIPDSLVLPSR
jgi:hypothetical protein